MDVEAAAVFAKLLGAGLAMGLGAIGPGIGIGIAALGALQAMGYDGDYCYDRLKQSNPVWSPA